MPDSLVSFLLHFPKVIITAIVCLAPLKLPDTRRTTQHWQSVGQAEEKTPCIFLYRTEQYYRNLHIIKQQLSNRLRL